MHDLLNRRVAVYPDKGAAVTTNLVDFGGSTGVAGVMNFATPIEVLRMGIVIDNSEALVVGTSFSIKLQKYLAPGLSTGAVDLGSISRTADVAAGKVVYNDLSNAVAESTGIDNSKVNVAPRDEQDNKYVVDIGQQLVWNLTDAADTSGKGQVFVEYVERPFAGTSIQDDAIKVTE